MEMYYFIDVFSFHHLYLLEILCKFIKILIYTPKEEKICVFSNFLIFWKHQVFKNAKTAQNVKFLL